MGNEDNRHSICEHCGTYFDSHTMNGRTAADCCCQEAELPNGRGNKERWEEIYKRTYKCRYCKPHSGCNSH